MPDPASPFETQDPAAEAAAIAVARADIAAGRTVENEAVIAWLNSWGTDDEHPPPTG